MSDLRILGGRGAIEHLRDHGLRPADVRVLAGAAGGPKWLILAHLDRYLFGDWLGLDTRKTPLHTLGASIGTWRFAAAASGDPRETIERFESAYLGQRYTPKPSPHEISEVLGGVLDTLLGADGAAKILAHPVLRTSVLAVRCRGATASERKARQSLGWASAFAANAVSRPALGRFLEQCCFHDERDPPPFLRSGRWPARAIPLRPENLREALAASGSIPLLMRGVRNVPGAPPGLYRDGGLADYHLDIPFGIDDGLVLYPHFTDKIVPGWFDKYVPWRKPSPDHLDRVLLVAPSRSFLDRLPAKRVPDRSDFQRFGPRQDDREQEWRTVITEGQRLVEAFQEFANSDDPASQVEPLGH